MVTLREWVIRLWATLRPGRRDAELEEELRLHLELAAEHERQCAHSAEEAGRAAVIRLGSITQSMEAVRDQRGLPWLSDLARDQRYGLRALRRNPVFASVAVLTLALGIGVTTALFSVFNAVLLRPLPYPEPDRLVMVRAEGPDGTPEPSLSGAEIQDLRVASRLFHQVAGIVAVGGNLTSESGDVEMERVTAANATDDFLPTLRVRPQLGRLLDERIDTSTGAVLAVLISHELWQRRYGGDPAILGRRIEVNNMPVSVVGVMPRGFRLFLGRDTNIPARIDVWFSAGLEIARRSRGYTTIARIAPGVTIEQARAEVATLATTLTDKHQQAYANAPLRLHVDSLQADTVKEARPALLALMGTVAFVLLIACANVANLLLARTTARSREMAVRAAIGAGRGRLLRQLVTEGLVLGILGGAAGLLIAQWTGKLLIWLRPPTLPSVDLTVDGRTLMFAIGASVTASLLFSLAPAVHGARLDLADALKAGERAGQTPSRRIRTSLVIGEVALSVVLLIGAGLMIRTIAALQSVRTGFQADGVLTMQATMQPREFREFGKKWQFYRTAMDRLRELPGVQMASAVRPLPLEGVSFTERFVREGSNAEMVAASHTTLPGYFETMGINVIEGRDFDATDIDRQRSVIIVDERFAQRAWPGGRAIGRQLTRRRAGRDSEPAEVIGVVAHVRADTLRNEGNPQVYLPYHHHALYDLGVVIKVAGDPIQTAEAARRAIESMGGKRPVYDVRPMSAYVDDAMTESRFVLVLLAMFAGLALALSAIGLYGVIAYTTAQRTREIGIRIALGAADSDIVKLIVGQGLGWIAAGLLLGLAGAAAVTRWLEAMLFGVAPTDALTFLSAALLLTAVAAAACYLPARRATQIDAKQALAME